ncbi:MAG: insulinase family protein [Bryobacteraceae bacterium]|nr:pitrilysin family protein [Bryobacterales bacterium]NUN00796.1 insulinase family protein [Bryobacteraceae bacterium]
MKLSVAFGTILAAALCAQTTSPPKPAQQKVAAALPPYKALKFPPLKRVQIPEIASHTLPNGIRLYLLENHELPLVSGFALIRTGNLFDPPEKIGVAEITGEVLRTGGTKAKTGDELDVELENMAASVESSIGETSGTVGFSALRENAGTVLEIFKEVLTDPAFRQDKIDLVKTQLRGVIARRNDNPSGIASREFARILYGPDTPYGEIIEYENLDRIGREDLVSFYNRYYFPANTVIAIQGDFSSAEMKAAIEKLFADWTVKQPPVPPFPKVEQKPTPGIFLAEKADVNQTFFNIGHLGGILKDKDYPALAVMADILGGGFSSRLFTRVRTQLGYAYGIGASWGAAYNHPGLFRISGSTKSASTVDTLKVVREEVDRIRTREVTAQELDTAKQTILNSFVFNFDSPSKTLNRLVTYEYHGYPRDFIFQYQKAIESVTSADVLRVAREHVAPENFTVVAVANSAELGTPLTALGKVQPIDLSIPEPGAKAGAKADAQSIGRGRQLLQRAQAAMGGADKLAAIRDATQVAEVEIDTGRGPMKATRTSMWLAPNVFRQQQVLPFGKITAFYDGAAGWIASPQGINPIAGPVLNQVRSEMFRVFYPLMLSDRNPDRTVHSAAPGEVEISDKQGNSVRLTIDETTGLPIRRSYRTTGQQGPVEVEEVLSEWKEVDGVQLPFRIVVNQGGKKFSEAAIREIRINTGLKQEELSKQP